MRVKLLLIILIIISITTPNFAFSAWDRKQPKFFEGIEVKANLGRTIIAVDKKRRKPIFIPLIIIKNYTKINSRKTKLKPLDIIDVWTDRKEDGLYVAYKIDLTKRPEPTKKSHHGRMERFRLIPIESIDGYIKKVVVDTTYQNVYIYGNDNKIWYVSRCVSGKNGWQIPRGNFKIRAKERNRYIDGEDYGEDYRFWVNYWMPFYGGAGLHDATWRNSFWINHRYWGSHGCINLPLATARFIYKYSKVGTRVIIK